MEKIEQDIHQMKGQLNELYEAMVGNKIANDGGLVRRVEIIEEDLTELKKASLQAKTYLKILWLAAGAIGMALFETFIKK